MKKVKKFVFISFLICSFTIPTTSFASEHHSTEGPNGFQTVFSKMLSVFQVNKNRGENFYKIEYVAAKTNNTIIYIDDKKFDAKQIEQYLKKNDKDYDKNKNQNYEKHRYHYHHKNCDINHGPPKDDFDSMGIWRDWYGDWDWVWWKKP